MPDDPDTIHTRIVEAMNAKGLCYSDLARLARLNPSTVYWFINGYGGTNTRKAARLLAALGLEIRQT